MKQIFIIILALVCSINFSFSQVKLSATLDTNIINIGDHAKLKLSAQNIGNATLFFPSAEELSTSKTEVLSQILDTTTDDNGKILSISQISTITSFEEGSDTLRNLFLRYQVGQNKVQELRADSLFLIVNSMDVDTNSAIKDIEDIMKVPITFREVLPWIILVLILVAIGFGIYYFAKRIKNHKPIIPKHIEPELPPEDIALSHLEDLRISALWKQGRVKEYHTQLTDILRIYLKKQFCIDAVEMTSEEILEITSRVKNIPSSANDQLRQILKTADMVKFAKAEPLPSEHDLSMSYAVTFVKETAEMVKKERQLAEEQVKMKKNQEQQNN